MGLGALLLNSVLPWYRPDLLFPDPRWSVAIGLASGAGVWWLMRSLALRLGHDAPATSPASEIAPGNKRLLPRRAVSPVVRAIAPGLNELIRRPSADDAVPLKVHHDELTGLWTGNYLDLLSNLLSQAPMEADAALCLLCVEVSGLDQVTERYGAQAGQQLLVQVARRLRQTARSQDLVFRLSGDGLRFLLLLSCPTAEGQALARNASARVLADLQRPLSYRTLSNLRVSANVGASLFPAHGATLTEALLHADEALHAAKRVGSGQFRQFVSQTPHPAAA